jgi:hypothetical protein
MPKMILHHPEIMVARSDSKGNGKVHLRFRNRLRKLLSPDDGWIEYEEIFVDGKRYSFLIVSQPAGTF